MSEKLVFTPEQHHTPAETHEVRPKQHHRPGEVVKPIDAQEARQAVEETMQLNHQTDPLERLREADTAAQPEQSLHINRELKQITLRRELKAIQRKLPASQRALSRVVHQPVVRVVSEGASKTISRPSGLLGGGLVALIGTSSYLYLAKHIGFSYNYNVVFALFVGGFLVGLALEFLVYVVTSSRRKALD